jgi:hypothetical protein
MGTEKITQFSRTGIAKIRSKTRTLRESWRHLVSIPSKWIDSYRRAFFQKCNQPQVLEMLANLAVSK